MKCLEATRTLSAALERPLAVGEQVELQLHLAVCSPCRNFRHQVTFLRESMQTYARRADDDPAEAPKEDRDPSQ
jgi:predicted anti-sigma-YlaC factor YlaD